MSHDSALHLFEGFGIELEYMIVDAVTLDVAPLADQVLHAVAGTYESEVECGPLSWSNELVLHVIELKTNGPVAALHSLPRLFTDHVRRINVLLETHGARLMPTAMHPWMDPDRETCLWPHEFSPVYETFNRVFDCRGHGWANLQSIHINLPFQGDGEFARLHAAIRLLLPIMPALAASSPLADGRPTGLQDYRLEVYRHNARRIPSVSGHVIPEPVYSYQEYQDRLLRPIYSDLAAYDPDGIIQHEWVNARGAIARFDRNTIEIRLLDMQECPAADMAVAAAIIHVIKALVAERWAPFAEQAAWPVEPLANILYAAIRDGDQAGIQDVSYLRCLGLETNAACTAGDVWRHLIQAIRTGCSDEDRALLKPIEIILNRGTLSRRILAGLDRAPSHPQLAARYAALCECLHDGRTFPNGETPHGDLL